VSLTGQVRWQTPLATRDAAGTSGADPLAVGGVAVFAQDGTVHGLRLTSGRPAWSYPVGQPVVGMWQWHGLVVVLSGNVGDIVPLGSDGRLIGLDAATGAVRWRLPVPSGSTGLASPPVATADGGLAMAGWAGPLLMVNMADGSIRWRRGDGTGSGAVAAADGLVFFSTGAGVTAYDDQTGAQRWTANGPEVMPPLQLAAGLLLVTDDTPSGVGSVLTAIAPATGRIAWQFHANVTLMVSAADPVAGIAVAASFAQRLYLLDPATGRVRWQAHIILDAGPLFTSAGIIETENTGSVRIVDRDAGDGRIAWQDALPAPATGAGAGAGYGTEPILADGPLLLLSGAAFRQGQPTTLSAYRLDNGGLAWRVTLPENTVSAPVPVLDARPGVLVQPALPVFGCTGPAAGP
jgi:outer membrane protein assembly factor BamB